MNYREILYELNVDPFKCKNHCATCGLSDKDCKDCLFTKTMIAIGNYLEKNEKKHKKIKELLDK